LLLNINTLAISYASKHPETGLILFKILVFKREKLQLGLSNCWKYFYSIRKLTLFDFEKRRPLDFLFDSILE
ncbi:MAG: hypothetical protein LBL07_18820, partial [Tannerella sp.]|nr:hypothetical protein [Tannerella sp.]